MFPEKNRHLRKFIGHLIEYRQNSVDIKGYHTFYKLLINKCYMEPSAILAIYSYFDHDQRRSFLSILFKDKKKGAETVASWTSACLRKDPSIKPIVREEFLKDLKALLNVTERIGERYSEKPHLVTTHLR